MNGIFCPPWGVYLWEKREIASRNIRPVLGTTHKQTNRQKGASWGIFFKLLETYKTKHSGGALYVVQCVFFTLLYFVCICDEDKFSSLRCLYAGAKTVIRASSDCILRCFWFLLKLLRDRCYLLYFPSGLTKERRSWEKQMNKCRVWQDHHVYNVHDMFLLTIVRWKNISFFEDSELLIASS